MDTRNKRMSMLGLGLAFRLVLPHPDGAFDTVNDRSQLAQMYALAPDVTGAIAISGRVSSRARITGRDSSQPRITAVRVYSNPA